ncbi:MAG: hypothetical protein IMZ52_04685 [Actinobacteria bacterium]|nr:hypothetical protein [Actinomycetota bacterium]MBE3114761.1 hypothetical protein [Actinomycetota bacterium]
MLICCWDSLRLDACEPFKGILGEESWTSVPSLDGFTGPILPAIVTGKSPEELGIPRDDSAFWSGLDGTKIDDTLFDHIGSYCTISRLIGPQTMPHTKIVPSRRGQEVFMPPIKWNAVSNWDVDIWRWLGKKWSMTNPYWIDSIFFWSFITHGNFSCYDSLGALESPEIKNGGLIMKRLAETDPQALRDLYMMGVYNGVETLKGLNEICGGKELIICFSDHNEALGEEVDGIKYTGHFHGMEKIPGLERVPVWINKGGEQFPEDFNQLKLKDWIKDMFQKYEVNNSEYQAFKEKKMKL